MAKNTKLYDMLGVNSNSSEEEIRKAYRKKSIELHPDKELDPEKKKEKEELYKELNKAKDILLDPQRRRIYDLSGNLEENIENKRLTKAPPIKQEIKLTLLQAYQGCTKKFNVIYNEKCDDCDGKGNTNSSKVTKCNNCRGLGFNERISMIGPGFMQNQRIKCTNCKGKGKFVPSEFICKKCSGNCTYQETKIITLEIPKGLDNNNALIREFDGNYDPEADLRGDIVFIVSLIPQKNYELNNGNLIYSYEISLEDLLCSNYIEIEYIDSSKIYINNEKEIINPEKKYMIEGKGFFDRETNKYKDLIIKFTVKYPSKIDKNKLKEAFGYNSSEQVHNTIDIKEFTEDYHKKNININENKCPAQ